MRLVDGLISSDQSKTSTQTVLERRRRTFDPDMAPYIHGIARYVGGNAKSTGSLGWPVCHDSVQMVRVCSVTEVHLY